MVNKKGGVKTPATKGKNKMTNKVSQWLIDYVKKKRHDTGPIKK